MTPGVGKYSATVNGCGLAGTRGRAIGPRSFSMWRSRASRTRSWCSTRPDTSSRHTLPSSPSRSSTPTAGDRAAVVDPHGHGVDVEDRQLLAREVELLAAQPAGVAAQLEVAHGADRAMSGRRSGAWPGA